MFVYIIMVSLSTLYIAFEFASWVSAEFKLYLIKEFQRLKEEENKKNEVEFEEYKKSKEY